MKSAKKRKVMWQPNAWWCEHLGIPSFCVWRSQISAREAYPEMTADEFQGYARGEIEEPTYMGYGERSDRPHAPKRED